MITEEQTKLMVEGLNSLDPELKKVIKWEFYPGLSLWSLWMEFLTSVDRCYLKPLDKITRDTIVNYMTAFIDRTYDSPNHGSFQVICDEEKNPPWIVEQRGIVCRIDFSTIQSGSSFLLPGYIHSFEFSYGPLIPINFQVSNEYIEWVKKHIQREKYGKTSNS
jgi:hypothetical protein